ncbi:uncharacterized protein V2V93DRAFT_371872 [Kockiozyma suomiensis]|uniref:uncharacterized protein n=1 Tax=Kockiozyma suomiensis TaxID=1337062 RepID=UPI00334339E1
MWPFSSTSEYDRAVERLTSVNSLSSLNEAAAAVGGAVAAAAPIPVPLPPKESVWSIIVGPMVLLISLVFFAFVGITTMRVVNAVTGRASVIISEKVNVRRLQTGEFSIPVNYIPQQEYVERGTRALGRAINSATPVFSKIWQSAESQRPRMRKRDIARKLFHNEYVDENRVIPDYYEKGE